jgi:glucosylglycerate synthase
MADLETLQEPTLETAQISRTDLLIAIAAPLSSSALSATMPMLAQACKTLSTTFQSTIALPAGLFQEGPAAHRDTQPAFPLPIVEYELPPAYPNAISWLVTNSAYKPISSLAAQLNVRACTVLGTDLSLNSDGLTSERFALLLDPALEGSFDLVMPLYDTQPFDDLVNKSILYPLTRALYGHRVRNPLGSELQMSSRLVSAFTAQLAADAVRQQGRLPWPATIAANRNLKMCQVQLGQRNPPAPDGIELSDALAQLVGPLFLDMEDNAAFWQRIRGSHDVASFGSPGSAPGPTDSVDVRHMVEAFQLGVRNLREIWSLILPPVTLLELKKLSLQTPDTFRMSEGLWARIVYDFALAYRLRNIHRAHLFGAFTPLYLGWVASYAIEMNRAGVAMADERIEQLARTYETEKPYLLSRWRWPDRFNP